MATDITPLVSSMSPQLALFEELGMFTVAELTAIRDHREYYKNKFSNTTPSCEDILTYVLLELDLLAIMREKEVDVAFQNKKNSITSSSAICLNKILGILTKLFPRSLQMWLVYIKFCHEMGDESALKDVLDTFVNVHKGNPMAFRLASRCSREGFETVEVSRSYLCAGLESHADCVDLYCEAFQLEFAVSRTQYEEFMRIEETLSQSSEEELTINIRHLYERALMNVSNVNLFLELYKTIKGIPYFHALKEEVGKELEEKLIVDEVSWNILASFTLDELYETQTGRTLSVPEMKIIIERALVIYKKATRRLNTARMWKLYLDRLWALYKDATVPCPRYKLGLLEDAFLDAKSFKLLPDEYYVRWADFYNHKVGGLPHQMSILNEGNRLMPTSVIIWLKKMRLNLRRMNQVNSIFREALTHFKGDKAKMALPIWKFMLSYYQLFDSLKVKKLFEEASKVSSGVANDLKPMYLVWMVLYAGIAGARKLFYEMAYVEPITIEFNRKMVEMEHIQEIRDIPKLRQCHDLTIKQFGRTNVSCWIDYIEMELKYGFSRRNIKKLTEKAKVRLEPALVIEFNRQMRSFAIEHFATD